MELQTKRLTIKDLSIDDIERFSEYRDKEEVARYQSWKHYPIQKAKQRITYCLKHPFQGKIGNYHLGIYLNDYLIGDIFVEIDGHTTFTVGYTLDSLYWSHGYASEALQAFLNYMKDVYHFRICLAYVYEDNERSIHLLEKNGFEYMNKSWFYQDILYRKKLD